MAKLYLVDFSFNAIGILGSFCFSFAVKLTKILLNDNKIFKINERAFDNLQFLGFLNLSTNALTKISKHALVHLNSLEVLDLSSNMLTQFSSSIFVTSPNIFVLSLLNNKLEEVTKAAFKELNIKYLLSEKYQVCCIAPSETKCNADKPWYYHVVTCWQQN